MRNSVFTLVCLALMAWNAFGQEDAERAKYELIRETINFLATDKTVSQDTAFRITCETLDYGCFEQQLSSNPITGIVTWYNRWQSIPVTKTEELQRLKERIFADILDRPGKGYRKQLAGYSGYAARVADLLGPPSGNTVTTDEGAEDTAALELVPDHAGLQTIYPEQLTDQIDNPENENPMIAYIAIIIGLAALALAALPFIKKKEPHESADFSKSDELHVRLDGIAMRMKNLEQKIGDAQMTDAVAHLTEIMESVEKRVVELERRKGE